MSNVQTVSKVQQIQNFFNNNSNMSRKDMMAEFVSKFGMTEKGASTYYSNAKRVFNGGSFHQTRVNVNSREDIVQMLTSFEL